MKKTLLALLVLLSIAARVEAQEPQPVRVGIEYDGNPWLEGEYAISISSMAIAPALFIGIPSATDIGVGIRARVYPFGPEGAGFYAAVAGIYDYHFSGAVYTNLDEERIGVGYRLILFKVLTGIVEVGWSARNTVGNSVGYFDNVAQPDSIYGEIGIGVAL
jgi:hypothetical protein